MSNIPELTDFNELLIHPSVVRLTQKQGVVEDMQSVVEDMCLMKSIFVYGKGKTNAVWLMRFSTLVKLPEIIEGYILGLPIVVVPNLNASLVLIGLGDKLMDKPLEAVSGLYYSNIIVRN